ncbi:MAG: rRNA maturation RNase YbeY [Elusimicrobia bacterium]|nr:rRNA maturation RNase YbeY [Elusimicrobiota bacterium]
MKITLHNLGLLPPAARRAKFEKACRAALGPSAKKKGELNLVFLKRGPMRRINKRYLAHDYDTDVISFPYTAPRRDGEPFGDVFVSVDQAKKQAAALGHDAATELITLAIHGTLHLVGYDDAKAADKKRMFARQDRLLRSLLG